MVGKQQLVIDLNQCSDLECPRCAGKYFQELVRLKVISALVSPTGKEELIPVRVLLCVGCGHVLDMVSDKVGVADLGEVNTQEEG